MKFAPRRTGMTLMEIMMSVMILGLGLLGILSVIPFIEYHSSRVVESDFTAAAGTNALAVIRSKQWEKPANWVYPNFDQNAGAEGGNPEDYRLPRLFDIFGEGNITLTGRNGVYILQQVRPNTDESLDICRAHDDIVVERDDNSPARPQLLIEAANRPEFTGAYSWAALMTPITSDPAQSYTDFVFPGDRGVVDDIIPRAEVAMKVDVLAFRGRDATDRRRDCLTGRVTGINSGYLGGSVVITSDDRPTDFEESLGSSTHILLIGPSNQQFQNFLNSQGADTNAPFFSAWYKISNFNRAGSDFEVTLSGPSFPDCWSDNPDIGWLPDICVVLFRNLRGVFSKTIPISERE